MKPATFNLANINCKVTISPDARRWVQEHVVSLETYAWAQAQRRLNGLPLDKGVSVVLDCEDDRGGKHAGAVWFGAEPSAAPVADTYATKKTDKLPERAAEYEPIGTMPVVGDRVRMSWGAIVAVETYDAGLLTWYGPAHGDGSPCGFNVHAVKDGAVRILRRTGEPRHPSAGQAGAGGVRVAHSTKAMDDDPTWCMVETAAGAHHRTDGEWAPAARLQYKTVRECLLCPSAKRFGYTELHGPEADAIIKDLCAKVPSAAAIINAKG